MGNKYHPVAVLVPNDDELGKVLIRHAVDMGVAISGFCKTTCIGTEKVVCNILANPNIRWLIVAGHESPGYRSGKALVMLHRYGVDPRTRRILCGPGEPCRDIPTGYVPNIPLELVERFRRQVTVVDLIVDKAEVRDDNVLELTCNVIYACVQEPWNRVLMKIKGSEYVFFDPGAFDTEPVRYTITQRVEKRFVETMSDTLTVLVADTIADAYEILLSLVREHGKDVQSRFGPTRELINVIVHILDPEADKIPESYPVKNRDVLMEYCRRFIEGVQEQGFAYTYGERLRRGEVDLLREAIRKLSQDIHTRQCVVSLWRPSDILLEEPPCITHIQLMVRDSRIHSTAYLRSHDVEHAFVHNAFLVRELMLRVREELSRLGHRVDLGTITLVIGSCHVYLT